jgi:hypothetical protein
MARHNDPLIAAMVTVRTAAARDDHGAALTAFRAAFNIA